MRSHGLCHLGRSDQRAKACEDRVLGNGAVKEAEEEWAKRWHTRAVSIMGWETRAVSIMGWEARAMSIMGWETRAVHIMGWETRDVHIMG